MVENEVVGGHGFDRNTLKKLAMVWIWNGTKSV